MFETMEQLNTRIEKEREQRRLFGLSDSELQSIRDRCKKATVGPWVVFRESDAWGTIGMPVCRMDDDDAVVVGHPYDWGPTNSVEVDANFIAHARTDVPLLRDEIDRLRKEVAFGEYIRLLIELHIAMAVEDETQADAVREQMDRLGDLSSVSDRELTNKLSAALYLWHEKYD